jgi:hypothetical protein
LASSARIGEPATAIRTRPKDIAIIFLMRTSLLGSDCR